MTEVEALYKCYESLSEQNIDFSKRSKEYMSIISAAAGSNKEKRLACQFIPQFFKNFPDLMNDALNAHLDLCEDPDANIRKIAIKALPGFCNGLSGVVPRISAILTQMLFSEDPSEYSLILTCLSNLYNEFPEGVLRGLFDQIVDPESIIRTRALKFIFNNLLGQVPIKDKASIVSLLTEDTLQVFQNLELDNEQIQLTINILNTPFILKDHQERISTSIAVKLSSFDQVDLDNQVTCERLCILLDAGRSFGNDGTTYEHILSVILKNVTEKFLLDLSETKPFTTKLLRNLIGPCKLIKGDIIEKLLEHIYTLLIEIIPSPPKDINPEEVESHLKTFIFNWTFVELIFTIFYSLYCKTPSFMLWNSKDVESIKILREKFQFLVRIMNFSRNTPAIPASVVSTKSHPRIVALGNTVTESTPPKQLISNLIGPKKGILSIIRAFLHNPPNVSANLTLSWGNQITITTIHETDPNITTHGHKRIIASALAEPPMPTNRARIYQDPYIPPSIRSSYSNQSTNANVTNQPTFQPRYKRFKRF